MSDYLNLTFHPIDTSGQHQATRGRKTKEQDNDVAIPPALGEGPSTKCLEKNITGDVRIGTINDVLLAISQFIDCDSL